MHGQFQPGGGVGGDHGLGRTAFERQSGLHPLDDGRDDRQSVGPSLRVTIIDGGEQIVRNLVDALGIEGHGPWLQDRLAGDRGAPARRRDRESASCHAPGIAANQGAVHVVDPFGLSPSSSGLSGVPSWSEEASGTPARPPTSYRLSPMSRPSASPCRRPTDVWCRGTVRHPVHKSTCHWSASSPFPTCNGLRRTRR